MKIKVVKIGNSQGFRLTTQITKELEFEVGDELDMEIETGKLILTKSDSRDNWSFPDGKESKVEGQNIQDIQNIQNIQNIKNKFDDEGWTW